MVSSGDVWSVGVNHLFQVTHTLIEHWNGAAWSIVDSPSPGSIDNALNGVAVVTSGDVWAVGDYFSGTVYQTLIERYNPCPGSPTPTLTPGPTFTPVPTLTRTATPTRTNTRTNTPTPIPTNTPTGTPSRTSTPLSTYTPGAPSATRIPSYTSTNAPTSTAIPTNTPTTEVTTTPTVHVSPSLTSCPLSFIDVPPDNTFYPHVRCLACRGIVNGYADGTFRPNNNVTRGQLSKIVSNSAGFYDPQPDQMFQDVPVGSTFQLYIGGLASRGYINGYSCGGPGEPCISPGNLPYFRPNDNATRGQIAKIDANAAGFVDPPVGQSFEDVPPTSTFYTFTQRLIVRSIMQGYPCNSIPSEPCVSPDNRPYFRPSNNATRGQASKIVANTFYSDCSTPIRR